MGDEQEITCSLEFGDPVYEMLLAAFVAQERQANKVLHQDDRRDGKYKVVFTINGVSFDFKKAVGYFYNRCLENGEHYATELLEDKAQKEIRAMEDLFQKIMEDVRRFSARTFPKGRAGRCETCGYDNND